MNSTIRVLPLTCALLALSFSGCLLFTADGQSQHLILRLVLDRDIASGAKHLAHVAVYPDGLPLKGSFVQISGQILAPEADAGPSGKATTMPRTVSARAKSEAAGGGVYHQLNLKARIRSDGTFAKTKKFKKDLSAGTLQSFELRPAGGDLLQGTVVILCLDVAPSRSALPAAGHCVSDGGTPTDGAVHTVDVEDNAFSPQQLQIDPGDTVRWVLVGANTAHTTTAMSGAWDSGFVFNTAGDAFERTFPDSEDGETFEYSCASHSEAGMKGSIQVGAGAPPPADGY